MAQFGYELLHQLTKKPDLLVFLDSSPVLISKLNELEDLEVAEQKEKNDSEAKKFEKNIRRRDWTPKRSRRNFVW